MKHCLLLLSLFLFLQSNAQEETKENLDEHLIGVSAHSVRTKTGLATYYHRRFEGRRTSSGVRYRGKKFTAAHLSLPFGTIVTVTNLSNGKSVEVEVNDRGPHSKRYIIDVSEGAAKELGFFRKGHSRVEISYTPKS